MGYKNRNTMRRFLGQINGYFRLQILCLTVLGGVLLLLSSCTRSHPDDLDIPQISDAVVPVNIDVSLRLSGNAPQTFAGDYELSLTDDESHIKRLIIMIVDLDASGNEVYDKRTYAEVLAPNISAAVTFRVNATPGPKHVYLVANMNTVQATAAIFGNQAVAVTGTTYESVISDFVTLGSAATPGANRPGKDIAMSGQAEISSQSDPTRIVIPSPTPGASDVTVESLTVTLRRCVAKVLLTCDMAAGKTGGEAGQGYVLIRDPQSTALDPTPDNVNNQYNGWMDVRDVWFVLNNSNRRTYIMQQTQQIGGTSYVSDPNFNLSDYVYLDNAYTPRPSVYTNNFISFRDTELRLPDAINGIPFSESTSRMRALPYDAAKANESDLTNHYTEGLYCLENTVHNDLTLMASELQTVPLMVSTYVVIGARYVPKFIYDETVAGNDVVGQTYPDMNAALTKLAQVTGRDMDNNPVTYPQGTFFYYYDGITTRFCTYKGMIKWIEITAGTVRPLTRRDFLEYKAGWGYYASYITGNRAENPDQYGRYPMYFKDNDGILRNNYYLLEASLFYVPGSNLPTNDLIMVNSKRLEWKQHGKTDVVVRPK